MVNRFKVLFIIGLVIGAAGFAVGLDLAGSDGVEISDGVPISSPNNNTVTIYGDTNISLENFAPSSDTVDVITEDGNMTVTSAGDTRVAVVASDITGTQSKFTNIIAGSTWIKVNPEDKNPIEFRGDTNEFYYSPPFDLSSNSNQDAYISGTNGGTGSIRYANFPANTKITAYDKDTGNVLDFTETDGTGQGTFDIGLSSHALSFQSFTNNAPSLSNFEPSDGTTIKWANETLAADVSDSNFGDGDEVQVDFYLDGNLVNSQNITSNQRVSHQVTGLSEGDHTYRIEATDYFGETTTSSTRTFTVDHYDPTASNLSPTGLLDFEPSSLEADIADQDFGLDGDTLTVDIYLDGTQIDTQTINANQTVSTSIPQSGQTGGQHTYRFNVTDSYGNTVDESASYSTPDNLIIRNELNHSEIIDDPINSTVVFYGDLSSYTRETTDGTINMTGLPINQEFVVTIDPSDGNWTERVFYVSDIYAQQSVYLLNTSQVATVESRFTLNDNSGEYDSETIMKIQRSINVSGTNEWRTIYADQFGTEGITAVLEEGVRHRIVVRNPNSNTEQVVGPYRAELSETVSVEPSSAAIDLGEFEDGILAGAELDDKNNEISYSFSSPNQVDQLEVQIYERNNETNTLTTANYFNVNNASDTVSISSNQTKTEWVVDFTYEINNEKSTITEIVGAQPGALSSLGSNWQAIVGVGMLFLLAGAFSVLNAAVGAVVVSLMGGILWWLGLFGGATSAVAISFAIVIAAFVHLRTAAGP